MILDADCIPHLVRKDPFATLRYHLLCALPLSHTITPPHKKHHVGFMYVLRKPLIAWGLISVVSSHAPCHTIMVIHIFTAIRRSPGTSAKPPKQSSPPTNIGVPFPKKKNTCVPGKGPQPAQARIPCKEEGALPRKQNKFIAQIP